MGATREIEEAERSRARPIQAATYYAEHGRARDNSTRGNDGAEEMQQFARSCFTACRTAATEARTLFNVAEGVAQGQPPLGA